MNQDKNREVNGAIAQAATLGGQACAVPRDSLTTDLLLLPDGRILAHNLTPILAELLKQFDPADESIAARALRDTPATP